MKPLCHPRRGLVLVTPEILIWNANQIMIWSGLIWFEPDFSPHDLISFDDSQKLDDFILFENKLFLRRFYFI